MRSIEFDAPAVSPWWGAAEQAARNAVMRRALGWATQAQEGADVAEACGFAKEAQYMRDASDEALVFVNAMRDAVGTKPLRIVRAATGPGWTVADPLRQGSTP